MNPNSYLRSFTCASLMCTLLALEARPRHPARVPSGESSERARVLLTQRLPQLDGQHLKTILMTVRYGPGEASAPHRHPCAVVGYVTEGAVRMRIANGEETVYHTGETFYEAPNQTHAVSANASETRPANFLAYFVCDSDSPLSTDVASENEERRQP